MRCLRWPPTLSGSRFSPVLETGHRADGADVKTVQAISEAYQISVVAEPIHWQIFDACRRTGDDLEEIAMLRRFVSRAQPGDHFDIEGVICKTVFCGMHNTKAFHALLSPGA